MERVKKPRAPRNLYVLTSALAIAGAIVWLAGTARAQGDDVLTYQLSLGTPHPVHEGGVLGGAPGQFVFPFGIAIDSTGRFIVTDTEEYGDYDADGNADEVGDRIQIFAPDGTLESVIGGDGTLFYPTGVAVDANDRIVVTDNDHHRILIFGPAHAQDVDDVDADLDTTETIGVTPQLLAEFGTYGNYDPLDPLSNPGLAPLDDSLNWPSGVAVQPGTRLLDPTDATGRLAVVDNGNHRVVVLSSTLQPLMQFGSHTTDDNPAGTFEYPWGVAIGADGRFFVSDPGNHRVEVFDANGTFQWLFGPDLSSPGGAPAPGDLSSPSGVTIDAHGRLIVADTDRSRVLRIDITTDLGAGSLLPHCSDFFASQAERQCQVETSDGTHYGALVLGGDTSGPTYFRYAQGVATDSQERVAIVDTDQHIVRVFQPARIEILSASAIDPGDAIVGEDIALTVSVRNTGGSPLQVVLNVAPSLAGTLTGDLSETVAPGAEHEFALTFVPSQTGDLTFEVGADGVHVSGVIAHAPPVSTSPAITVAPAPGPSLFATIAVDKTIAAVNDTITVSVTLVNNGGPTFNSISPVVTFAPAIVTPLAAPGAPFGGPLAPGSRTLTYTYTATATGTVTFSLDVDSTYEDGAGTHAYQALTATSEAVNISTDVVPPVTTATAPQPSGSNGWYVSPFTVTLSAADVGGSGVQSISYRVSSLEPYSATVTGNTVQVPIVFDGETAITFSATDAAGNTEPWQTVVFHLDTVAPTAGQVVVSPAANAAGWHHEDVTIQVFGGDHTSGVTPTPPVVVTTEGANQLIPLTVTDVAGNVTTTQVVVNIDKTAPSVSCSTLTSPAVWPPNHKLVPWETTVAVFDALSGGSGFVLASAASSEPDNGRADGNTTNDIQGFILGAPDTAGFIRAERASTGSGRTYSLTYEGRDLAGNVASCVVLNTLVPHDQGNKSATSAVTKKKEK